MPNAPAENRESPRDIEPKVLEASKADAEQSKESLLVLLEAKMERISEMRSMVKKEGREHEQYEVAKNSVDRRHALMESMA